jgi:ribonucleoside-diphosphate reductase alpha chain
MGFAEMLVLLGIPYDSEEAIKTAEKLMSFIEKEAHSASQEIGKEKGNFPNFEKSIWHGKVKSMRNCACTTIAPTGTISIIAGCSSGIEPIFALAFMREVLAGKSLFEMNKIFQHELVKEGIYSEKLVNKIALQGNLKGIALPEKFKKLFETALDIPFEQHIKIQAVFQKYTDNAVSKTINLPNNATPKDVEKSYMLAYKSGCKGITIYRYGSKPEQVLYLGSGKKYSKATSEFAGGTCIGSVCTL